MAAPIRLKVLLIEDSLSDADRFVNAIKVLGYVVRAVRVDSDSDLATKIESGSWDLLLCTERLGGKGIERLITHIHHLGRDLPCLIMAVRAADSLYRLSSHDVVIRDSTTHLQFVVKREIESLIERRKARKTSHTLLQSEQRARLLLDTSRDAIAYIHAGMHIHTNSAYLEQFGLTQDEEVVGLPILDLIAPVDQGRFKQVLATFSKDRESEAMVVPVHGVKTSSDSLYALTIELAHTELEGEQCIQVLVRPDVNNETVAKTQETQALAVDALTQLYNRTAFIDTLTTIAGRAGSGEGDAALIYITLNECDVLTQQYGEKIVTKIIQRIAQQLQQGVVATDFLAYVDMGVFAVLVDSEQPDYIEQRARIYQLMIDKLKIKIKGQLLSLMHSLTVTRIGETHQGIEQILQQARQPAVTSDTHQRSVPPLVTGTESEKTRASNEDWLAAVKAAMEHGYMRHVFQPIANLHGDERVWFSVQLQDASEAHPIYQAVNTLRDEHDDAVYCYIEQYLFEQVMAELAQYQQTDPESCVFIPLSRTTLMKPGLVPWLRQMSEQHQITDKSVIINIEEAVAVEHIEDIKGLMGELAKSPFDFGLSEFGSGMDFSATINELAIDYITINKTFIETMGSDSDSQAVVKATIDIAKQAKKISIADNVTEPSITALLWQMGVDYAQGTAIAPLTTCLDEEQEA